MHYGTTADLITYASDRGISAVVEASPTALTQALTRATDYIRTKYVLRLGISSAETNLDVIEATYIAATHEIESPRLFSKRFSPLDDTVMTKAGAISWQPVPGLRGADVVVPVVPAIESLLLRQSSTLWAGMVVQ